MFSEGPPNVALTHFFTRVVRSSRAQLLPQRVSTTGAAQSITFRSFIVAATATSGGTVTFSSGDVSICTVTATVPPTNEAGQYKALVTLVVSNT